MHTPASALRVVLEGSSQCCGKLLWKLQEGFLEAGVPEITGTIVEGQVRERLRRAMQTEGAMASKAGVSVSL